MHSAFASIIAVMVICAPPDGDQRKQGCSSAQTAVSSALVPTGVAAILTPILNLQLKNQEDCGVVNACGEGASLNRFVARENMGYILLAHLFEQKGPSADEGIVVLMHFFVRASYVDALVCEVSNRGTRMQPYLDKYRVSRPRFPDQNYPDSIYVPASTAKQSIERAIELVRNGKHCALP